MNTTTTKQKVRCWKFSDTATEKPTREIENPKQFLESIYQKGYIGSLFNMQKYGILKERGWAYDFKPYLKSYVVKQHGTWQEYYAPNKTALRKSIYGGIQKIVEII